MSAAAEIGVLMLHFWGNLRSCYEDYTLTALSACVCPD